MKTVFLVMLSVVLFSCSEAQGTSTKANETEVTQSVTKDVSAEEFKKLIEGEGVILDVRTPDEYTGGHLENAKNIDVLASEFEIEVSELDKTKPVYVYCKSGGRSGRAMNQMKKMGFTTIYNLKGGYSDWSAKGLPTTK